MPKNHPKTIICNIIQIYIDLHKGFTKLLFPAFLQTKRPVNIFASTILRARKRRVLFFAPVQKRNVVAQEKENNKKRRCPQFSPEHALHGNAL